MSWLMGRLLRWLGAFDVTDEMYDGIDAAIAEGGRRLEEAENRADSR